jgi:hypothetical protein
MDRDGSQRLSGGMDQMMGMNQNDHYNVTPPSTSKKPQIQQDQMQTGNAQKQRKAPPQLKQPQMIVQQVPAQPQIQSTFKQSYGNATEIPFCAKNTRRELFFQNQNHFLGNSIAYLFRSIRSN